MEKDVQIIDTSVIITKFSPLEAKLQKMAEDAKGVTAKDFADKAKMALVKTNQLSLRDARVELEKIGKMLRDPHTDFNRQVKSKEEELIAIIEPEEKRLKAIRAEADELAEKEARKLALPQRCDAIWDVYPDLIIDNEQLLSLDSAQFIAFVNELKSQKLEEDRQAQEAERIKEQEALAAERRAMEEERAAIEKEKQRLAHEKEVQEAAEQARINERNRADEAAKNEAARQERLKMEEIAAKERAAKEEAERQEREKIAAEEKAREEQEALEAKKKYQNFLAKYEYADDGSFKIENDGKVVTLYKKLGTMKL